VALLLWSTPLGTVAFWLALGALLGVLAMQAVYWIAIHPINKFWLQGKSLSAAGSRFFSFDPTNRKQDRSRQPYDWNRLRDRWELSHVVRAVLALVSLVLVAAVNAWPTKKQRMAPVAAAALSVQTLPLDHPVASKVLA
jgi:hypothetical protein